MGQQFGQEEHVGIRLLKKGKRGMTSLVFSRLGVVLILFLIQLLAVFVIFRRFARLLPHLSMITVIVDLVMVPVLLSSRLDPTSQITWLMVILVMPVFGALLYAYTRSDVGHRALKRRIEQLTQHGKGKIAQDEKVTRALEAEKPETAALVRYMSRSGCYPAYSGTKAVYFSRGEDKWTRLLSELEKAKDFIFLDLKINRYIAV